MNCMTQRLTVEGMTCEGCEESVRNALTAVSGVTSVSVDHSADSATVEGSTDIGALVAAVEDAGYEAAPEA